jgi:hypothetical protein
VGDVVAVPTQLTWLTCHHPVFGGRQGGGEAGGELAQVVPCWPVRSAVNPMRGGGEVAGGCSGEGLLLMMTD